MKPKTWLSKNVIIARIEADLTQVDTADICGITARYISDIEAKGSVPSLKILALLSIAFGCEPYELLLKVTADELLDEPE